MKHILIVEDELNMAKLIQLELEHEGYTCSHVGNGKDALDLLLENTYDVVILDLMLPKMNGVEVCRKLRLKKNTPIIMLTARDTTMDKVNGLQAGADDYLAKPFAMEELLARIEALLRRSNSSNVELSHRGIILNVETRKVYLNQDEILLTTTEFQLLYVLMKNPHKVLSRDELMNEVWGYTNDIETNIVDVYIRYLRNKIETPDAIYIHTVRGIGYRFE